MHAASLRAKKQAEFAAQAAKCDKFILISLRDAIYPDQKLIAWVLVVQMRGSDELKRGLRDRRFKRLCYPLLKFQVWMHDKVPAVWWSAKILIPANFIVSDRKQSQKIKPAMSQNACHRRARAGAHMHDLCFPCIVQPQRAHRALRAAAREHAKPLLDLGGKLAILAVKLIP